MLNELSPSCAAAGVLGASGDECDGEQPTPSCSAAPSVGDGSGGGGEPLAKRRAATSLWKQSKLTEMLVQLKAQHLQASKTACFDTLLQRLLQAVMAYNAEVLPMGAAPLSTEGLDEQVLRNKWQQSSTLKAAQLLAARGARVGGGHDSMMGCGAEGPPPSTGTAHQPHQAQPENCISDQPAFFSPQLGLPLMLLPRSPGVLAVGGWCPAGWKSRKAGWCPTTPCPGLVEASDAG